MADPLHSRDFREFEFDTRTSEPVGTGLEQNGRKTGAYQAPLEDPILKGTMRPERELPEAGNPRLNRTAEQIGSALGRAVTQARRVPDTARRGLHVVRDRAQEAGDGAAAQISNSASSLAENAQRRAREFVDVAEARGRVLLDKADDLTQNVAQRASEIKQELDERTRELRAKAKLNVQQARWRGERLIQERPLHILGGITGAAFLLGVSIRIVRSRNASRY
jgi:ElaB/YqjD/DUF883 family membrane-anchored ribosome-binding protein